MAEGISSTELQRVGIFIVVASTSRERSTTNAMFAEFRSKLPPETLNAVCAAAAIMAMNNL